MIEILKTQSKLWKTQMDEKIDGEKNDRRYVIHKKDLYEQYHSALNSKDI